MNNANYDIFNIKFKHKDNYIMTDGFKDIQDIDAMYKFDEIAKIDETDFCKIFTNTLYDYIGENLYNE